MHTTIVRSGLIGLALAAFLGTGPAALAEVITYKAALAQAEGKLASLVARVDRLELDFVRAWKLIKSNAIAQAEYDQVAGDRSEAKASVEAQKAVVAADSAKIIRSPAPSGCPTSSSCAGSRRSAVRRSIRAAP